MGLDLTGFDEHGWLLPHFCAGRFGTYNPAKRFVPAGFPASRAPLGRKKHEPRVTQSRASHSKSELPKGVVAFVQP